MHGNGVKRPKLLTNPAGTVSRAHVPFPFHVLHTESRASFFQRWVIKCATFLGMKHPRLRLRLLAVDW